MTVVPRKKMFDYDWGHPLTWIAAIAFLSAIFAIIVFSYDPNSTSIALLSSILTLIASSLISHLVTYSQERKQFSVHLAKFSAFAKRRVDILCTDLNLLSIEITETEDLKEAKRIVLYALKNLEQDAKASVQDIDDMRKIDEDDDLQTTRLLIPPSTLDSKAPDISIQPAIEEKVIYTCTACGYSNTASLKIAQGSTRHVECANCRTRQILHRLARGLIRVVSTRALDGTSNKRASSVEVFSPEQPSNTTENPESVEGQQIQDSFLCPRCQHRIRFTAYSDQRTIERPCFSCLSIIAYDRRDRAARIIRDKKPHYFDAIDDTVEFTCTNCQKQFFPRLMKTEDGKQLFCCFSCNSIYLPSMYRKKVIEKTCPTLSCGNTIGFKIDDANARSHQFCFECMSRLEYDRATDEVSIVEKLYVPKITDGGFKDNGTTCLHCHHLTSGRYTRNSRGQRLSICWSCKNVFEFIDSEPV